MWSSAPDRVFGSDQWCEATTSRSLLVSGSTSRMDVSCTAILAARCVSETIQPSNAHSTTPMTGIEEQETRDGARSPIGWGPYVIQFDRFLLCSNCCRYRCRSRRFMHAMTRHGARAFRASGNRIRLRQSRSSHRAELWLDATDAG